MERNEWKYPVAHDIERLLDLFGVTDETKRERLVSLVRDGRLRGWWHPYQSGSTYIGLESEAVSVLNFEALWLPGLLQTADYAREVIRVSSGAKAAVPVGRVSVSRSLTCP